MSGTIPASQIVSSTGSVLSAGGNGLVMNGLLLVTNTRVPIGQVLSFPNAATVASYCGATSKDAALASIYFNGFQGAQQLPGELLLAQCPQTAVAAYLRSANIGTVLTLAQIQALSGSLTVVMDGYTHTASSVSLASATSYSAAAALIQAGLTATEPTEATFTASIGATFTGSASGTTLTASSVTGLISVGDVISGTGVPVGTTIASLGTGTGGAGTYITSAATTASAASLVSTSKVLDVTAVASGTLSVGQTLTGTNVPAGTIVTGLLTGTGLTGLYQIGIGAQIVSESMTAVATAPAVSYDSVTSAFVVTSGITGTPSTAAFATGSLAIPLLLTQATGAVLSQGAPFLAPGAFMNSIVALTQNWALFATVFNPDSTGNANKLLFAQWANSQANRYGYVCWDTDITPTASVPATTSLGYLIAQASLTGTCLVYDPSNQGLTAFILGWAASLDFTDENGAATLAFKQQSGLLATVTSATAAANLISNGYNFYGAYATANQAFTFLYNGQISGPYDWTDAFVYQIWLTNAFQLALMELLIAVLSIPYNAAGYAMIEGSLYSGGGANSAALAGADSAPAGPIQQALTFGIIDTGVTLSAGQIQEVNNAAGKNIAATLQTRGWYLQVLDPGAQVRGQRGSPACAFWYTQGGSVQQINIPAIELQ